MLTMKIIQPFPLSSYLSVVVCLSFCTIMCCRFHMISLPKNWVLCILLLRSLMMCAYNQVHYGSMIIFMCLHIKLPHYHHYADLSEGIELQKCMSGNSVSSVYLRFSQFSQLSFMQYVGLCLLSLPISLIIVIIRILCHIIIIKSELWSICHCVGLKSGNNGTVCIFIFCQDYGILSPLAIETPSFYTRPLKKC